MEKEKLDAVLAAHASWCRDKSKGERADLQGADLRGADLRGVYLRGVYLQGVDLQGVYFQGVYLQGADLQGADLQGAYLQGAYLRGADLRGADFQGADLQGADLQGAYLRGADLRGASLPDFQIVPEEGAFIAFKATCDRVLKLEIPADAKRTSSLIGRKCRASHVKVLVAYKKSDEREISPDVSSLSNHDGSSYRVGEITYSDTFDDDIRVECTHGIHFFMTYKEAAEY